MRAFFRSVYVRNFITIVLLFCVSFFILGMAFAGMSYSFILRERSESMVESAQTAGVMLRSFAQAGQDMEGINMKATLSWISRMSGYHTLVTDSEGRILNCSDRDPNCPHLGGTVPAQTVAAVNREGIYRGFSDLNGNFERSRFVVGIALPAGSSGYIFVSDEAGRMSGIWRGFAEIFLFAAAVVVLLSFALAFFVIRKLSRPIKEMSDAARSYSRGDFTPRVHTGDRHDEVSELARAFNVMADSLERSEKSRRELIANVSHELKTPMTTISGYADGILDGTVPPERETECLQIISSETKRLSRLVRGMLDMSQIQSVTPMELQRRSFDLLEVVCQSLLSLEQKITSRGLDVETVLPEDAVYVSGDADAITQVVHNLLDNAAKFASPGSTITVKLWREEGKAFVSVANRGETIPKEELPRIFERFHKTDASRNRDRDGVGLGLYIAKTILDSHQSSIFVSSRDGVTTFAFDLRLARGKNGEPREN